MDGREWDRRMREEEERLLSCTPEEQALVDRVARDLDGEALKELFRRRTADGNKTWLLSGFNTIYFWGDVTEPLDNEQAEVMIGPATEIALDVADDRLQSAIYLLREYCYKATRTRIPDSLAEGVGALRDRVWRRRDIPDVLGDWSQVAAYYANASRRDPERGGRFTLRELTFGEGL